MATPEHRYATDADRRRSVRRIHHFAQRLFRECCGHDEPAISFQSGIGNARYFGGRESVEGSGSQGLDQTGLEAVRLFRLLLSFDNASSFLAAHA